MSAAIRQGTTRGLARALSPAVLARCRAEGPRAHALLLGASLLDDPFDHEILAEIADVDASSLTERLDHLCDRGLLAIDGLRYRFRNGIYRDALRGSISPARQQIIGARAHSAERDRAWLEKTDPAARGAAKSAASERSDRGGTSVSAGRREAPGSVVLNRA